LKKAQERLNPLIAPAEIKKWVQEVLQTQKQRAIPEDITLRFMNKIGVYCMSEIPDSLLMWSHYANHHEGFCVGFDTNNKVFGKAQPIIYSENYPVINIHTGSQEEKTDAQMLTKSKCWEYEREWRIIDHDKGEGTKEFPKESLLRVIFGCQIATENKNKIISWCQKRLYKPNLFQAEKRHRKFALDLIPIPNP
jgi:hypothetical protein